MECKQLWFAESEGFEHLRFEFWICF
jgi:hypothetical protein